MNVPWPTISIGELFDIGAGKSVTPASRGQEPKRAFLRTSNVLWGRFDLADVDTMFFTDEEFATKNLRSGDLLVCEGGDIGRASVWQGQLPECSFQNHLHRLRPRRPDICPEFYQFALEGGITLFGLIEGVGNRTTIPNLSRSRLAELAVPLPPFDEQQKIAAVLGKVQAAVAVERDLMRVARELKHAALRQLFTCGLFGEPQKKTDLGPVPESWEVVPLGTIGRVGNGSTPRRTEPGYWTGGTIPWLTSARVYNRVVENAVEFVTPLAVSECHLPKVPPDSLIIAITGQGKTLGHVARVAIETCVSQHLAFITMDLPGVVPDFLRQYLDTCYAQFRQVAMGGGSTKGALTCSFLKSFLVPLAPQAEQREIVDLLATLDAKIAHHEARQELLRELFRTLLHDLLIARRRVAGLDLSALTS